MFDSIIPELSRHEKTQRGIKATLRKQESGKTWNRLIGSSLSTPWLTKDFDHTIFFSDFDSDDDDAVLIHRTEPWVDPSKCFIYLYFIVQCRRSVTILFIIFLLLEYAFEYDQSELSLSSSSDEEMEIIKEDGDYIIKEDDPKYW